MSGQNLAQAIRDKALELGYAKCGIISVDDMAGYAEKLKERIERFPQSTPMYNNYFSFARPQDKLPWARSIVVGVHWYGKYQVPTHLEGMIGKTYLFDQRRDAQAEGYRSSLLLENYMHEQRLRTATERDYQLVAVRWAAMQAGLGIIRRNNFFYTEKGSWLRLESWLIDEELELKETPDIKKCPVNCTMCVRSCPSGSLAEAFSINGTTCVSFLTSKRGCTPDMPLAAKTKGWVYGCDACQNACPNNKRAWSGEEAFPGLDALAGELSLEKLVSADYSFLREHLAPKFWYIEPDDVWKWKTNALNAMRNNYVEAYRPYIEQARQDEHEKVRDMAELVAAAVL